MCKQFAGNVNQVSQQINAVAMAIAGAERIVDFISQAPEQDEGYVTLVNAKREADGSLTECPGADRPVGLEASASRRDADVYGAQGRCAAVPCGLCL